jgi:hypothetical protein
LRKTGITGICYSVSTKEDGDMQQQSGWPKLVLVGLVLAASVLASGCFGGPAVKPPPTTDLLLKSGFLAEPVKDPGHLERLPFYQFAILDPGGKTVYVYTDPRGKKLYFGSQNDYYRYKAQVALTGAREALEAPPSARPTMTAEDWDMYSSLKKVEP